MTMVQHMTSLFLIVAFFSLSAFAEERAGSSGSNTTIPDGPSPSSPSPPSGPTVQSAPPVQTASPNAGAPAATAPAVASTGANVVQGANMFNPAAINAYNSALNASTMAREAYMNDVMSGKYDNSNYQLPLLAAAAQLAAAQQAQQQQQQNNNLEKNTAPKSVNTAPTASVPAVVPPATVSAPAPSDDGVSLPPVQTWQNNSGQQFQAVIKDPLPAIPAAPDLSAAQNLRDNPQPDPSIVFVGGSKTVVDTTQPSIVDNLKVKTQTTSAQRNAASQRNAIAPHSADLAEASLATKVAQQIAAFNKVPAKKEDKPTPETASLGARLAGLNHDLDSALVVVPGIDGAAPPAGAAPSNALKSSPGVTGKLPYRKVASMSAGPKNMKAALGSLVDESVDEQNRGLLALFGLVAFGSVFLIFSLFGKKTARRRGN
jgi:hypothetical protein